MAKKPSVCDVTHWAYIALIAIAIYYAASHYFLFVAYPIQQYLFRWGPVLGGALWTILELIRFVIALYIFRWFLKW